MTQSTEAKITTGRESVKSELKGSVKEPNMFRSYETEKITRKAGDVAENLQLYRVVRFFDLRSSCTTTHKSADVQGITLIASCMTISGRKTKQLDIFCHVTGFTSDFLSFLVVELIWFFHGAPQLCK